MTKKHKESTLSRPPNPDGELVAEFAAKLLAAVQQQNGLEILCQELARFGPFENFIVYLFRGEEEPELIYGNRIESFRNSMQDYIHGLFTLDPFFTLTKTQRTGLFRMQDIMPPAFPESEYYNHFYRYTNVADELRYVVALSEGRSVHVFVEREGSGNRFSPDAVRALHCLKTLIVTFLGEHLTWLTSSPDYARDTQPRYFDLQEQVRKMKPDTLTPREVDTVELMLKGHSTKSIAQVLSIDHGTVANHKRNLYAKLEIHSQAELFNLFLSSLVDRGL